ncbi:MAG TPA: 5-oxoprolinase subunit PxpB [Verrucomicrobiae bacterium]|nr:5-oxoprolinase subunit PxpB [Verrucomicrobiae bacterium]
MKWTSYGPDSWLLQFAGRVGDEAFAHGRALVTELERHPPPGLVEFVPSFTTILLEFSPGTIDAAGLSSLATRLRTATARAVPPAPVKEIPVVYDGPDLGRVAEAHELTTHEVGELHSATLYKVYLLGFSPGFPYLGDLDPRLHTPRLAAPRLRVAAGSVAIGGEHTGIYPVDSPGGWNIIGRTTARLFDPAAAGEDERAMFLLKPGDRVRFVPTHSGAATVIGAADSAAVSGAADSAAGTGISPASARSGATSVCAGESPAGRKAGESPAPLPGQRTPM